MGLKSFNPYTASRRFMTVLDKSHITKDTPEKNLLEPKKRSGGRNNHGEVVIWHRGGGHKKQYRVVDFRRDKDGVSAKVASIEYDPNRSANIALLHYADGDKRYILHPVGLEVGATVSTGEAADRLFAPPGPPPSFSARKATSLWSRCLLAKFASFRSIAALLLARSAMWITKTRPTARLAARAGRVFVPRCAASP